MSGSPLLNASGQLINPPTTAPKFLSDAFQVKGAVDDVLQHFGARKLNTPSLSGRELQTAQEIRGLFSKPGGVLETHAPELVAANRAYEAVMKGKVEPLKKSFVGTLAGKAGALEDVNAPQGKLLRLFDQGTQPKATRSEILTTMRQLNKSDPELVLDAGKTWITTKLDQALNSPGARDAPTIAKAMVHAFGSPQKTSAQTQGLSDVLAGMAEAQKLPPGALQGLPKFLNYVAMATERPSTTAGVTASEIAGMEAESAIGRIGHTSKLTWLRQPILAYTDRLSSNTRAEVDRLLSSPEGIQMLYELSRTSPWTEPGQRAITAFIAGTAKPPEENPPGITAE